MTILAQTSRTFKDLKSVLIDLKLIEPDDYISVERLYPGYWQRSKGAWSFAIDDDVGHEIGGSQWNCREIIQHHKRNGKFYIHKHEWGAFSIYPVKDTQEDNTQ